jgi:glutamate synthase domain-containing protein 2
MARQVYYIISILSLLIIAALAFVWLPILYFLILVIPYILLGIYDMKISTHSVLRLYPVIGHLRYLFEFIRPEIQQYFVATNLSGRPFSREVRSLVYARAHRKEDAHPFGTEHDINEPDYFYAHHSLNVKKVPEEAARILVGNSQCQKPYLASRINISGMSFGAISATAVEAMNLGAKMANIAQNTGEGGLTKYHLQQGGDIIWQLGTGYFGCRDTNGNFDPKQFKEKANLDAVKMIEIKISQGAKPSHGGLLPGAKISAEIAEFRGVLMGVDCLSPATHKEFSTPIELMDFITRLREMTSGKPIGFKLCIGVPSEFMGICKAMLKTGVIPDFITVDGAEGGTGAAPLEFSNRFGMPLNEGLAFVHNCLVGINLRDKIRVIASGKVATSFDVVMKWALGADMINQGREMMFAIGCIQALRCHTNTCPTGIATQDPRRAQAIVVKEKAPHIKNYYDATMKAALDLTGAMGVDHPDHLTPDMIYHRMSEGRSASYAQVFHYIEAGNLLSEKIHHTFKHAWEKSSAEYF